MRRRNRENIRSSLQENRSINDSDFDKLFSKEVQKISSRHFSEVKVAHIAAEFLAAQSPCKILDVGSGVGKFCIIGALGTPAQFHGIEMRSELVEAAKEAASILKVPRVSFRKGDALEADWSLYQGIYLFNPFYENLGEIVRISKDLEPNRKKYLEFVHKTQEKLSTLPLGTRVVTYYGYGGAMPSSFERQDQGLDIPKHLHFWEKKN